MVEDFLTVNPYSRPRRALAERLGIVMHWTGAPTQNEVTVRDFFERVCPRDRHYSSAHYIIGQSGRILHVIPDNEMAYHCGSKTYTTEALSMFGRYASDPQYFSPNQCTIGIELCPVDSEGRFTQETLDAASSLVRALMSRYKIKLDKITTHHAVVGWKDCPRFWVKNPEEFKSWKETLE